ncbi:MAG: hypothetical protein JJE37_12045 [Methyloceanibacter sp.]|jgi:hypothetical protein|nr:hypothetical protein [Methyloceanibacter sp.]
MRLIIGAALTALLAVSGPSLLIAADQPEAGSTPTIGAASGAGDGDPAKTSPGGETSPAGETANPGSSQDPAKAGTGTATMNVNRHRPGACPEGPPCKEGD